MYIVFKSVNMYATRGCTHGVSTVYPYPQYPWLTQPEGRRVRVLTGTGTGQPGITRGLTRAYPYWRVLTELNDCSRRCCWSTNGLDIRSNDCSTLLSTITPFHHSRYVQIGCICRVSSSSAPCLVANQTDSYD